MTSPCLLTFAVAIEPLARAARCARVSGSTNSLAWFVGTVTAIGVAWVFVFYGDRLRRRWHAARSAPRDLFHDLCDAHQLSRTEREHLARFATAARLARPALLFVDPAPLSRFASSGDPSGADAAALLRKLFAPPEE